jgi:hypothetical protein
LGVDGQCLLCERVEATRLGIGFDLRIPALVIELREPLAKLGEFIGRERLHRALNVFDAFHHAI